MEELLEKLHPLERKVVPFLADGISHTELVEKTGLKDIEVMRALQWLENKDVLKIKVELKELIDLDVNGHVYRDTGLPEQRFLEALKEKALSQQDIQAKTGLKPDEMNISVGILKRKAAIDIRKDKALMISLNDNGKKLLKKDSLEERFLKKDFPVETKELEPEERFAYEELKKRKKILTIVTAKIRTVELTALGQKLAKSGVDTSDYIDTLTPQMLKTGAWKKKRFRAYDTKINVPKISGGKRHFVNQAIDYVRRVWMDLGFQEMRGPLLDTSFWNFDALFVPQDHPAREMQDTFFIKKPMQGKLPDKVLVERVKKTHESGWTTGSSGWQSPWSEELAKRNVLRTHTTILSARTIAKLKESDLPAKFFSVGTCFRNEALDWSHLFEFHQVEGIVVDPDANFKHLLGYLRAFFKSMGYPKARIRPAYFPYTEPSVEIDVFHPMKKEWIELGGAGMFRPEVVKPLLGKEVPVLAWGPGFSRIILQYYGIKDIRELYSNDLKQLREMKVWLE